MASPSSSQEDLDLLQTFKAYYPTALKGTHLVPDIHFINYLKYEEVTEEEVSLPGTSATKLPSAEEVKKNAPRIQGDMGQRVVLHNLRQLGKSLDEDMFVVSELDFKAYLNKPFYHRVTKQLPKPATLPLELRHHGKQGDFDVLLMHRQRGATVGEIKTVKSDGDDKKVVERLTQGTKQLEKCAVVARHMFSDLAPDLPVTKTLFLPFLQRGELTRVLDAHPKLLKVYNIAYVMLLFIFAIICLFSVREN